MRVFGTSGFFSSHDNFLLKGTDCAFFLYVYIYICANNQQEFVIIFFACERKKKRRKVCEEEESSRRWRGRWGERDWTETVDEDLRVKHARIIVSGDKNVPLFLFSSLAPFFFYLAFSSSSSLWHTPRINLSFLLLLWGSFWKEREDSFVQCVCMCTVTIIFIVNDGGNNNIIYIWGCENEKQKKKRGHFRSCVRVYLSDQRIVFSVGMSCSNPLSFLQYARTGFFPSPPFKKKEEGEKQASCNYVLFLYLLSCARIFCMWMMMYCAMW